MLQTTVEAELEETVDELIKFKEKAERINGRIIPMMSTGYLPNRVASRIFLSLYTFSEQSKVGFVFTDGMGFAVPMLHSGRQSFSPDVAYYSGPPPKNSMRLIEAAPIFAVEVRSECDYGPVAESEMAAKRVDYFEAGTITVWDVDTKNKRINCYRKSAQFAKEVFQGGQFAYAEPAVQGWNIKSADIFRD